MREIKSKTFGRRVTFDDSPEIQKAVFEKVIEYFIEYDAFDGETVMQMDNPQIYAPVVLSEIADKIIKFKVDYND